MATRRDEVTLEQPRIVVMNVQHFGTIARRNQLKDFGYAEVALVGRSNCGKSTLLNALLAQKKLARTSAMPGRTQMIYLYLFRQQQRAVLLADLPGYGYTKAAGSKTQHWQELMEAYCSRSQVSCFLCLLDIRRSFRQEELGFMRHLQSGGADYMVVFTKQDKLTNNQLKVTLDRQKKALLAEGLNPGRICSISALRRLGVAELRQAIMEHAACDG